MNRIALEELNRDLSSNRAAVDSWAQAKLVAAEDLRDHHVQTLRRLQDDIARLEAENARRLRDVDDMKARLAEEAGEYEQLRAQLSEVQSHCSSLPSSNQQLQHTLERETRELQLQESALTNKEALREGKLQALRQALDVYRERLGLHFRKDMADELLLIFTHIDPSSHMREFLLGVHVQEDNTYNVTRCQPALEGLDDMLADLNRTNSFKTFVRQVRRDFRMLVN